MPHLLDPLDSRLEEGAQQCIIYMEEETDEVVTKYSNNTVEEQLVQDTGMFKTCRDDGSPVAVWQCRPSEKYPPLGPSLDVTTPNEPERVREKKKSEDRS